MTKEKVEDVASGAVGVVMLTYFALGVVSTLGAVPCALAGVWLLNKMRHT